jgi:signal transduction histidine kinase/ABC-type amino acid transport substrate-binding protein
MFEISATLRKNVMRLFPDRVAQRLVRVLILMFALASGVWAAEVPAGKNRVVRVAVPGNFPPQYVVGSDGVPGGATVEMIDALGGIGNMEIRYVVFDAWDEMLGALSAGEVDLIPNSGLSRSALAGQGIVFSEPLERFPVRTFVLKRNAALNSQRKMNEMTIGAVRSSFALPYLKRVGVRDIEPFESVPDCVDALLSGAVDAVVCPQAPLIRVAGDSGVLDRISMIGEVLFESREGFALSAADGDLLSEINAAIGTLRGSDLFADINGRRYVGDAPYWSVRRVFGVTIVLLLLPAVIFFGWRARFSRNIREELNVRDRSFLTYYNSIPTAAYTWRAKDGGFVLVNYNCAAMKKSGNRVSEDVGKKLTDLYADGGELSSLLRTCIERRCTLERELTLSPGGTTSEFQVSCFHLAPDCVIMHANDVTIQRRIERRESEYRRQLQALAAALSDSEEKERRKIASELHDTIGQNLALSKIRLVLLSQNTTDPGTLEELSHVLGAIDESIRMTRALTFELGTPVLYKLGFGPSVNWLAEKLYDEYGLRVAYDNRGLPDTMVDEMKAFLFRALRELLMNVVKHAGTDRAKVVSSFSDKRFLRLSVIDHGKGFDAGEISFTGWNETSFGLFSLKERLKSLGGHTDIRSIQGRGTRVTLVVPVEAFERKGA